MPEELSCPFAIFAYIMGTEKEFMATSNIHVTADMIMLYQNSELIGPSLSNTGTSTSFQDKRLKSFQFNFNSLPNCFSKVGVEESHVFLLLLIRKIIIHKTSSSKKNWILSFLINS